MPAISSFIAVAGIGLSVAGAVEKYNAASQTASASSDIYQKEMQEESVKREAMEVKARRDELETMRNAQRARSLGLTNATNRGAEFGSGLQGGFGEISGEASTNITGVQEALSAGEQTFDINKLIGADKMRIADAQRTSAIGTGLSTLGAGITGNLSAIKGLSGSLFSSSPTSNGYMGTIGGTGGGLGGLY